MKKTNLLLIALLAAIVLLVGCKESDTDTTFDFKALNRERVAWEAQSIADYAFTIEQNIITYPSYCFRARVTVKNNVISGIEVLSLKDYLDGFHPGEPGFEDNIRRAEAEYINDVESTVNRWGGIAGIYDWLSSSFSNKERHKVEVRYNAQYHYLEYVKIGSPRSKKPAPVGASAHIIEISNFEIAK